MNQPLNIVAWNVLRGLNNPEVRNELLAVPFDVAVLSEATREDEDLSDETMQAFGDAGYDMYRYAYNDDDGRADRHALVVAVRSEVLRRRSARRVRLAGRTALQFTLEDGTAEGIVLLAGHLDDRTNERRLLQTRDALDALPPKAIVAGDLNATHRSGFWPRTLRLAAPLVDLAAKVIRPNAPTGQKMRMGPRRIVSLLQRVTSMANGTVLAAFQSAGFADASEDFAPTKRQFGIAVQLDHILYRGIGVAQPTVTEHTRASDHARIRAGLAAE